MKYLLSLIISFVCIFLNCIIVNGIEISDITPLTETEMPSAINFSVSSVCFGHDAFNQADADEEGNYVIYSICNSPASKEEKTFRTRYIDVYNKDGNFICEICFTASSTVSVRIHDGLVYAIMYHEMIVYDPIEEIAAYYTFPGDSVWETSVGDVAQEQEFSIGAYSYRCERNRNIEYVRFIRSDGQTEEILTKMNGTKSVFGQVLIYFSKTIFVAFFIAVIIIFFPKISKRLKSKKQQHRKSTEN